MDQCFLNGRRTALGLLAVLAGLSLSVLPQLRAADAPKRPTGSGSLVNQAAAALYEGVRTETLPNGLRIYLKPVPNAPVVTTMVAYKVGSADEDLDHTGLSHYLEHLMFKGTEKIRPGDIDRLTLRNGGANNAYTSEDYTIFHFDFAADRWDAALQMEADRMRNLRIDKAHEFNEEKGAVIAELERNEDEPWDLEQKEILPLLFDHGPYGHPVIGERAHVREATAEVIKSYYDRWYYPNNASLIVCGGFDPDKALARIKELFGPLPKGQLPERKKDPGPAKRNGPVRKEMVSKFDVPRMLMGFNGTRLGTPDSYVLDVVQAVLTSGKTGRLYRKLIEEEVIAGAVDSTSYAGRYPGWFSIQAQLLKGKSRDKAENLVLDELKKLRDQPVSDVELKRVKETLIAAAIFGRESVHSLADSIARGVTTNDLDYLKTYLARINAVTAKDVQDVARKYFDPQQRVVIWSVPKEGAPGQGGQRGSRIEDRGSRMEDRTVGASLLRYPRSSILAPRSSTHELRRRAAGAEEPVGHKESLSLEAAKRVVLPNGMVLLLYENHRLPIVVVEAVVRHVRLLEPADKAGVAVLVGKLLDEGTAKHTGPQIAELIEDVGGVLNLSMAGGSVKVLSRDRSLGLGLLFECLGQANFPKDAFARQQEQLLSEIDDAERQPESKAQRLFRQLVYGKHPFARPLMGTRKTVEPLTPADCAAFYKKVFVPENMTVAVVGDFQSQEVIDEITKLTADWKKAPVPKVTPPPVEKPKEFVQRIVSLPEAAQLHFLMGEPGIRRDNPDYYKLLVMDYVLGTGPGFTDRLSARLRDREGLAYTVTANMTSSASEEVGIFTCYIGTEPGNFGRVKKEFLEELNRIRTTKPAPEEVADAKAYLLGSLPFQLITNERIAAQLLNIERYHLGLDYLEKYKKAVAAVTPEDVEEVAKKYIDPEHLVLVAVGAVDPSGNPLHKLPPPKK